MFYVVGFLCWFNSCAGDMWLEEPSWCSAYQLQNAPIVSRKENAVKKRRDYKKKSSGFIDLEEEESSYSRPGNH